jgi:twitching motility protein PilT
MLQAGGKYGMVTMDMSLAQLVRAGRVSLEDAFERCSSEDDVRRMMNG